MIRGMGLYKDGEVLDTGGVVRGEIPGSPEIEREVKELYDQALAEPGAFVWIGLFEPTKPELAVVADIFALPPLQVDDAANHRQRPKVDRGDDWTFVVMKILAYYERTSDVETGQIAIFVSDKYVVTVRHGPLGDITGLRARLQHRPELLRFGPSAVVYALMDEVVDGYVAVSEEVAQDIEEMEEVVFSPSRSNDAELIYRIKRENLEMRRAVYPLIAISRSIVRGELARIPEDLQPYYGDVADHLLRVAELTESNDALLMTMLMAANARQDLQTNDDMRRISAYVAIAAVPTMIAGIYGMNFEEMPELTWDIGYPLVMALMAGVCLLLWRAFKRSGWL